MVDTEGVQDEAAVAESSEGAVEETATGGYTVSTPTEPEPELSGEELPEARMGFKEKFVAWRQGLPGWVLPVAALAAVVLVATLIVAFRPGRPAGSSGSPDGTAANALQAASGPVDPAVPEGVTSWTTWAQISLNNSDMEASMIEAHDVRYHKYLNEMLQGEKNGAEYKRLFPRGTRFINCDYNVTDDGKFVFFWDTLKEDTWFLTFPDGEPAVKMTCGNTVIFRKLKAEIPPPPPEEERCPPAAPGFDPRTPDGGSKVFQPPQEQGEVADATNPAPSLERGLPEVITRDQETANPDQPSDYGAISPNPPPPGPPVDDGATDVTDGTVPSLW